MKLVSVYIGSVVLANLFTAKFGPYASILSAFFLIGATLTLRDKLHERWHGKQLVLKMAGLIAIAGALSALISIAALRIAIASFVAFVVSEGVDTLVYHHLKGRPWLVKANGSNVPSALVDSILFPLLAFGAFFPVVTLGQFVAKTLGGAVWSLILHRARLMAALGVLCVLPTLAQAQIVSVNGAWIKNDAVNAAAGEAFIASPEILKLRPYTIISWNTDAGAEPTVLARVGYSRFVGGWQVGVGAGIIHVPGDPRLDRPSFSAIVFAPGGKLRPYGIVAYEQPFGTWDITTFVGVNYTIYFGR